MAHSHCVTCFSTLCNKNPEMCPVVYCKTGCHARLHQCKVPDHALVCSFEVVDCINADNGCTFRIPRCQMQKHLLECPAYVVLCCFQWVRRMLQDDTSQHSHFIRKPTRPDNQLDLALTFYDQRRGKKKLAEYIGKSGTRSCQDVEVGKNNFKYSYMYNPAHPTPGQLHWYRTGTKYKAANGRPPFMRPIPSFLQHCAAYQPPLYWRKPIYLTANKLPHKDKVLVTEQAAPSTGLCLFGVKHVEREECSRVEPSFSCYNVIALNNLPFLHRSEASLHMSCGQILRRNQIAAHTETVHNQIMSGIMDGWMIERCPLAVYGCGYYRIRVRPKGGKLEVQFDDELGVFYLRSTAPTTLPNSTLSSSVPKLPAEIWCLIGQYCDSYTLFQLCKVSRSHNLIAYQLLHSRGLAHKRWARSLGPRCWATHRKVTRDDMHTIVNISCSFAACKRWEPRNKADWGLTTSLSEITQWELADKPHISIHLAACPYNVRVEHSPRLAQVYGHPIIDPTLILRNF